MSVMRGRGPPVSEAELHGFADGDLDRSRREAVLAYLAASPRDAARVETWRTGMKTWIAPPAALRSRASRHISL